MDYIKAKHFYKYAVEPVMRAEDRTLSGEELRALDECLESGIEKNPRYLPNYAVKLAILTGMRVGELAALKWEHIHDGLIIVKDSEKHDRETGKYFIETTKTGRERFIPLTKSIEDLLKRIKKVQLNAGYVSEFVFGTPDGNIHASALSDCAIHRGQQAGIGKNSIHALRRTLNSNMRCNGVSATVASSILGNTEEVNNNNYTYDITDIEDKREILTKVQGQLLG